MKELDAGEIHFVGQQDGKVERIFLTRVVDAIECSAENISSAYLCRVHFGDSACVGVALCMVSQDGDSVELLEAVSSIFHEMFGSHEHLDMLFLNESQEQQIQAVCDSFYPAF